MRLLSLILLAAFALPAHSADAPAKAYWVFFGTYTGGTSKGIYRSSFDPATGETSKPELAAACKDPSFLAIGPKGDRLFAVSELSGAKGGAVLAFSLDAKTGKLEKTSEAATVGSGPCHLSVHPSGKFLATANYGAGSTTVIPIDEKGKVGEATQHVVHMGKVHLKDRQGSPKGHSANFTKDGKYLMVADLGLDKVIVYDVSPEGKISANESATVSTAPGAGPRHFAFHPSKPFAFVINEINCTLDTLGFDEATGKLTEKASVSTLPKDLKLVPQYSTAEVVVHPNGKFVYGSNRTSDSIACFALGEDGTLTPTAHVKEGVKVPRNFAIDPTGAYMFVANQEGDNVLVWKIDATTGVPAAGGTKLEVGKPVCVRFAAKGE